MARKNQSRGCRVNSEEGWWGEEIDDFARKIKRTQNKWAENQRAKEDGQAKWKRRVSENVTRYGYVPIQT